MSTEELRLKRLREASDTYEIFDGQKARNERERKIFKQKLLTAMKIRSTKKATDFRRQRLMLQRMIEENDFIPHWNFQLHMSCIAIGVADDPFGLYNEENAEDLTKSLLPTPSNIRELSIELNIFHCM